MDYPLAVIPNERLFFRVGISEKIARRDLLLLLNKIGVRIAHSDRSHWTLVTGNWKRPYLFFHTGLRFSSTARMPSCTSSSACNWFR